jgi:hypothetical protein
LLKKYRDWTYLVSNSAGKVFAFLLLVIDHVGRIGRRDGGRTRGRSTYVDLHKLIMERLELE